jgi:hypothetical protein
MQTPAWRTGRTLGISRRILFFTRHVESLNANTAGTNAEARSARVIVPAWLAAESHATFRVALKIVNE